MCGRSSIGENGEVQGLCKERRMRVERFGFGFEGGVGEKDLRGAAFDIL